MTEDAAPDFDHITCERRGAAAIITFDRPDRLNAYLPAMGYEIIAALDWADACDEVRAVIVTGRGRAFCAGADIGDGVEIFERGGPDGFRMDRDADTAGLITRRLLHSNKPVIAAINGAAVGVGITATLAMDFRLAVDSATIAFPFTRLGLVPEGCSSWLLPKIVGVAVAADWIVTGRTVTADEALRTGLVRSLHDADDLLPAALELAESIARDTAPVAVAVSRRMLWGLLEETDPAVAHELDSRGIHAMGLSADVREALAAFHERRPAQYRLAVSRDLPQFIDDWIPGSRHPEST